MFSAVDLYHLLSLALVLHSGRLLFVHFLMLPFFFLQLALMIHSDRLMFVHFLILPFLLQLALMIHFDRQLLVQFLLPCIVVYCVLACLQLIFPPKWFL